MPSASATQRHEFAINSIAERVRWLPSMPPGPADLDGRITNHGLVIYGQQDNTESNFLLVHNLAVTTRDNAVLRMDEQFLTAYDHVGKMTDLHVCEQADGQAVVLLGTSEGSLHVLRLRVPRTPGAGPEEVQRLEGPAGWPGARVGLEGQEEAPSVLPVWVRPHKGAVAAVDMQPDTQNILTVGADGNLFVLDMEQVGAAALTAGSTGSGGGGEGMDEGGGEGDGMALDTAMDTGERRRGPGAGAPRGLPPGVLPYKAGSGCVGYTCGCWVDRSLFVTSRTVGGLELWDVRCPPTPVSRSHSEWGATGLGPADRGCHRVIHCLQVHPARPDVCASGGSGGAVALWDLRAATRPLGLTQMDEEAGPVWEVRFDTRESAPGGLTPPLPGVLFCTDDGALCRVSASEAAAAAAAGGRSSYIGGAAGAGRIHEMAWQGQGQGQGVGMQVLAKVPMSINSFDVGGPFGTDVVAVTGRQTLMYMPVA